MIVPSVIASKLANEQAYLKEVSERVRDIVFAYCDREGYAYSGRIKSPESLTEKIETGRFEKWSELDDLFACSIIIPTLKEEVSVVEYVRNKFNVVKVNRRGSSRKDPSVFRFDATRVVARLRNLSPETTPLNDICFEVQIRTAFEHAWSVTTHALVYKGGPIDWRRLRLAAQLKASVEQLDHLILGFDSAAGLISEQFWAETAAKKAIQDYFQAKLSSGIIPQEVAPDSWQRFCDNVYSILLSSPALDRHKPNEGIRQALAIIGAEIATNQGDRFPRSITLLQFIIGSLAKSDYIGQELGRYTPMITSEMKDLFHDMRQFQKVFDFGLINAES